MLIARRPNGPNAFLQFKPQISFWTETIFFVPEGELPYLSYIGMCGPKGYGFSAVLVIVRVSILADFGHK